MSRAKQLALALCACAVLLPFPARAEADGAPILDWHTREEALSFDGLPFSLGETLDDDVAIKAVEALETKLKALEAEQREIQDLAAQQDMAWWAKFVGIAGAVSAVAAILAALFANHAVRSGRRIANIQLRPYVHASKAEFGEKGNLLVTLQNGGQTPASQFFVNGLAILVDPGSVTASIAFRDDAFKAWSSLGVAGELVVSILEKDVIIRDYRKSLEKAEVIYGTSPAKGKLILICGQVLYLGVDGKAYRSQFAFYADRRSDRLRRPVSRLVTFQELVSRKDLKWLEHVLNSPPEPLPASPAEMT